VVQFIRRRHPAEKVETVLSSAGFGKPTPLQTEYVPASLKGRDLIVESISGEGKTIAQLLPFFFRPRGRRKTPSVLILVGSAEEAAKYEVEFNRLPDARTGDNLIAVMGKNPQAGADLHLLTKHPGLIVGTTERIIDHIRRNNLRFGNELMVVVNIPGTEEHANFDFDVEFIFTKLNPGVQKILFTPSVGRAEKLSSLLKRPGILYATERRSNENFAKQQENTKMKTKDEQFPQDTEILKGKLTQIVQLIKEDEDPEVLNGYRKLIKKTVPLHLRGYVTAYLFKQVLGGGAMKTTASGAAMQTIFVSIGKNRKVFPRDLAKLFRKNLNLGQNEIGNIKVLDNYSFIDVPRHAARKAIDALDGIEFHGRNITVNFARKKKGENDG